MNLWRWRVVTPVVDELGLPSTWAVMNIHICVSVEYRVTYRRSVYFRWLPNSNT